MMLKGIDPLLSPDLLHILASMGHGDELLIAFNKRARKAFAIVATGERRLYGNIFLSKGVVNPEE